MDRQRLKTKKGLDTLLIHSPQSKAACVQIWFRAGSALETENDQGIAHFLEHMFFKGTKKRPGSSLTREVESYGGEINAFTSFDYTCYYINTPNDHLEQSTDILLDMTGNPLFHEDDIPPERGVVFEEYRRSLDKPDNHLFHQIQKSCFTEGYAHPILGREETINNFLKEQLIQFRKKYYNLAHTLLIISGDLKDKKDNLIQMAESCHIPQGKKTSPPSFHLKNQSSCHIYEKDVPFTTLNISVEASPLMSDQAPGETLLMSILGMGESSRLHQGLVTENSMANVASTSSLHMTKGGVHVIRLNFPSENLNKIIDKLIHHLQSIAKDGFSTKEIQKIKNQFIASKIYERETLESTSFNFGYGFAQNDDIDFEDKFIERVKAVSLPMIEKAIKVIYSRPFHINLQIPQKQDGKHHEKNAAVLQQKLSSLHNIKKNWESKKKISSRYDSSTSLFSLQNGVDFLYRHNTVSPTFAMQISIKSGLSTETLENRGLHHVMAGLLTKGYKNWNRESLDRDLDNRSASLCGFSGKESYGINLHGLTEQTEELLEHLFGSLWNPSFLKKEWDWERVSVERRLKEQQLDPVKLCFLKVAELMFDGHPYSFNPLGTTESLHQMNPETFMSFHENNLQNKKISLIYCGSLPLDELMASINSLDTSQRKDNFSLKPYTPKEGEELSIPLDREQSHIFMGIATEGSEHEDQTALKLLSAYLGGQSSELFVEVRDRQGLCYSVSPIHHMALQGGFWGIYLASGHDKKEPAIKAVSTILNNIRDGNISRDDFETTKKMIEGQNQLLLQTNEDYVNNYAFPTLHNLGIDHFHENNQKIRDLNYKQFQSTIGRLLSKKWNRVVVGRS